MSVLVIGASGSVGSSLFKYLQSGSETVFGTYNSSTKVSCNDYHHLDARSTQSITDCLSDTKPTTIIYVAGVKDFKKCQTDPLSALNVNALSIQNIYQATRIVGLSPLLIYLSTDYVFAGYSGGYNYTDPCEPNTAYGYTKHIGEQITMKLFENCVVLRSSAIMIPNKGFFGWLSQCLKDGVDIEMYSNVFFSPTPIMHFCETIYKILNQKSIVGKRIMHCSSNIRVTRYEFACCYAQSAYPDQIQRIKPKLLDFQYSYFRPDLSICDGRLLTLSDSSILNLEIFC